MIWTKQQKVEARVAELEATVAELRARVAELERRTEVLIRTGLAYRGSGAQLPITGDVEKTDTTVNAEKSGGIDRGGKITPRDLL